MDLIDQQIKQLATSVYVTDFCRISHCITLMTGRLQNHHGAVLNSAVLAPLVLLKYVLFVLSIFLQLTQHIKKIRT